MKKRIVPMIMVITMLLTVILPVSADQQPEYLTRIRACSILITAADDYSPNLVQSDIIKGYEDGTTKEEQFITRAECFVMISRAFGKLPAPVGANLRMSQPPATYTDVPDWAKSDVDNLINARVVVGTEDGTLHELELVTKEQLDIVIRRIWALLGSNMRDDFYNTINKKTLDSSSLKIGETTASTMDDIANQTDAQIHGIINDIIAKPTKSEKEQKIANLYQNIINIDARNEVGYKPIAKYLAEIDACQDMQSFNKIQKELMTELSYTALADVGLGIDDNDNEKYILYFYYYAPFLEREAYLDLNSSAQSAAAFKKYVSTLLTIVGDSDADKKAEELFKAEKTLAAEMLNPHEYSDVSKVNNRYTPDELQKIIPAVDIKGLIADRGFKVPQQLVVMDEKLLKALAGLYIEDNLELLKTMLKVSLIADSAGMLSQPFVDAEDQFLIDYYGLAGKKPINETASLTTQNIMSDYLGEAYIAKYFSPQAKENVQNMVKDFIEVYRKRIQKLDWMSDTTKQMAIKKLDNISAKVGYPDKWDDLMDNVKISSIADGGTFFENVISISKQAVKRAAEYQLQPVDKSAWHINVFEVNAYYNPNGNEIVFPAGILQGAFYDESRPPEANYGAIGVVIAHEITHAFDNDGAKFDENGNVANWWTEEDYKKFNELTQAVIAAYDKYEIVPGVETNGEQTVGENIADLGGVSCALEVTSKLENPDYKLFFESYANIWCYSCSRQFLEYVNRVDVHSIPKARVNVVLQNTDIFSKTYNITEKDGMYVENKVSIW